jgi:tetratricopeptide (TPR) repeat protein
MLLEHEAIVTSQTLLEQAGFHFLLAVVCHHAEQAEEALQYVRLAQKQAHEAQHTLIEAHALRFEGEVLRSKGEYSRSLEVLEQALQISRAHDPHILQLAECLYQCGVTLRLMGEKREAMARQEEALRLRLEAGEDSGTADCLREVARMKAQEGETLWVRVLLSHAFMLYERAGNGGGKAAAQIEMGDLCQQEGQIMEAKTYWQKALRYWEALGHQRWQEGVRKRLQSVSTD